MNEEKREKKIETHFTSEFRRISICRIVKRGIIYIIGNLLLKFGFFRYWYKEKLSKDLFDLELSNDIMSKKEIYDRKLKEFNELK